MQDVSLHSGLASVVCGLLTEKDETVQLVTALLQQPQPMRAVLHVVLSHRAWEGLSVEHASLADERCCFYTVVVAAKLSGQPFKLMLSGDSTDLASSAAGRLPQGGYCVSGELPDDLEGFLDRVIDYGFRVSRRYSRPRRLTWHEIQVGKQVQPPDALRVPNKENGWLRLLLGQDDDRAMELQVAWGAGFERLKWPPARTVE